MNPSNLNRRFARKLGLGLLFLIPALATTATVENLFDLGPSATFGLLMLTALIAGLTADRIVGGPMPRRHPWRDRARLRR